MIHEVRRFIARIPLTRCGIFVDSDKATADPAKVQCKNCKKRAWKW